MMDITTDNNIPVVPAQLPVPAAKRLGVAIAAEETAETMREATRKEEPATLTKR